MKKYLLTLLYLLLQSGYITAQDNTINYIETLEGDSVMIYLSNTFKLTGKECADYTRQIRADVKGDFYGSFEDKDMNGSILAKGKYTEGKKDGYFEVYHSNGSIWSKGMYVNNEPVGKWEFFYQNGMPERVVNLANGQIMLIDFFDTAGVKKVDNGNGIFKSYIAYYNDFYFPPSVTAEGKIVNGKPDSIWKGAFPDGRIYCEEEYKNGKIIRGEFPKGAPTAERKYRDRSYLNAFFLKDHFSRLEELALSPCITYDPSKAAVQKPLPQFKFDMKNFDSDLRNDINRAIENDIRTRNTAEYREGDNEISVQFKVNNDGKAEDFIVKTGIGRNITDLIQSAIRRQVFPVNSGTLFFRLNLHFIQGGQYRYSFRFSRN